ncbi:FAD-dependent oxidoreductase [Streptomyces sp. M19]
MRTADGAVLRARALVNCAGLHCDRVARLAGDDPGMRIVPFRGEYFTLPPSRAHLVTGLVYPVPDPAFPFLGVHLTRGVDGGVHIGPNAVPALARRATAGAPSARGTWPGPSRTRARGARPATTGGTGRASCGAPVQGRLHGGGAAAAARGDAGRPDTRPGGRACQAVLRDGTLADDFLIRQSPRVVHVLNAPSPAATASLPIGREIARRVLESL